MDTTIRLAALSDLGAINQIIHDAYHHYIPRIGTMPGPMLDDYAPVIASQNLYVAENRNNDVLGVVAITPKSDSMMLSNLAVAPSAQGAGLGRKLMEFAERLAIDAGFTAMTLFTNQAMTENIEIYGKKGYVETHRGVERGLKRVYMRKTLKPEDTA